MNNALTSLSYELSPANPQWYAARVTFLNKTPSTGFDIEKLSTMYHHENGFRTIISNIDINFSPSSLIVCEDSESMYGKWPKNLLSDTENMYLSLDPFYSYLESQLSLATGIYYPMNRESFIINKDSYNIFLENINNEFFNKKYVNKVSLNNKCGNNFQDVYYSANPSGQDPWYGPLKNTPVHANIEFLMDPSINRSITYLFLEAVYNIINNAPQRSIIPLIVYKTWDESFFANFYYERSMDSLLDEFNNDNSIVQKPLDFIIFIHFPYTKVKTRKNFDVEVFGNRILNMNPLKPSTSNIQNKPEYRRF